MNQITETVINSLKDLLGSAVKMFPAIAIALIIIMLTRYADQYAQKTCPKIGNKALQSKSLHPIRTLYFYNQDKYSDRIPSEVDNNNYVKSI